MGVMKRMSNNKPSPSDVAGELSEFDYPLHPVGPPWRDFITMQYGAGHIGEIRVPEDWDRVPRARSLLVVFLNDEQGEVLRWGDDEMHKFLGGDRPMMSLFIRQGDPIKGAREGHIHVNDKGEISVQG